MGTSFTLVLLSPATHWRDGGMRFMNDGLRKRFRAVAFKKEYFAKPLATALTAPFSSSYPSAVTQSQTNSYNILVILRSEAIAGLLSTGPCWCPVCEASPHGRRRRAGVTRCSDLEWLVFVFQLGVG